MAQAQLLHLQSSNGAFNLHDQQRQHNHHGYTYPSEFPSHRQPITSGNSRLMAQAMMHQYRPEEYLQGQQWQPQPLSPQEYKVPSTARTEFAAHSATYPQNTWGMTMFDHGFALNNGLQMPPYVMPQSNSRNASNADIAYNQMAVQGVMGKNGFQYANGFAMPSRMAESELDSDSSLSPRSYNSDNMGSNVPPFSPDPAGDQASPCTNWSEYSATSFPVLKASTSDSGSSKLSMAPVSIRPREGGRSNQYTGLAHNSSGSTLPSPVSDTSSHRYNGLPASYGDTSPIGSEFSASQKSSPGISPWHPSGYSRSLAMMPYRPRDGATTGASSSNQISTYQVHGNNDISQNLVQWSNTRANVGTQGIFQPRHMLPRAMDAHVQRKADDDILLQGKKEGLTYKEIRKKMHTKCAESTLRGRYRSLTKARKDRVRKPVWREIDIQLLNEFVQQDLDRINANHYQSLGQEQRLAKVQWKKVADYIVDNGGSYHFGNSTCKRKWLELHDSKGE